MGRSRNDRYGKIKVPAKNVYVYPLFKYFEAIHLENERLTIENGELRARINRDSTDQEVSEGTLVNVSNALYEKLESSVKDIKEQIIDSDVVHFDETGMRSGGGNKMDACGIYRKTDLLSVS